MGRTLSNDFSWSKSRHEKFSECLRAYYFYYYRSWGGWEVTAPEEVRRLYVLKKLHNRFTWAGGVVHEALKGALTLLRQGRKVDPAGTIERAHLLMQGDFRHSQAKAYWREKHRKEFAGLVEHEYGEPVSAEEWKLNWETVKGALGWFFESRWVGLAQGLRKDQWLEVDEGFETSSFRLEGTKVFAIPDFAYVDEAGNPTIVDWKTGREREGYDDQVLGYALYLSTRYGFPVEKVQGQLVYLNDQSERRVPVEKDKLAQFREKFGKSVTRMKELLEDPRTNAPHPEAYFPKTDDLSTCARCVFRRECGREGGR